jgi:hypothetical protein
LSDERRRWICAEIARRRHSRSGIYRIADACPDAGKNICVRSIAESKTAPIRARARGEEVVEAANSFDAIVALETGPAPDIRARMAAAGALPIIRTGDRPSCAAVEWRV